MLCMLKNMWRTIRNDMIHFCWNQWKICALGKCHTIWDERIQHKPHVILCTYYIHLCVGMFVWVFTEKRETKKSTIENMIFGTFKMYHCSKWWKLWVLYLSSKLSQTFSEYSIILFSYNFFYNYNFLFYCYLSRNMTKMRSSKGKWPGNNSQRSLIIIKNLKRRNERRKIA